MDMVVIEDKSSICYQLSRDGGYSGGLLSELLIGEINFDSVLLLVLNEDRCEPLKIECTYGDLYNDI